MRKRKRFIRCFWRSSEEKTSGITGRETECTAVEKNTSKCWRYQLLFFQNKEKKTLKRDSVLKKDLRLARGTLFSLENTRPHIRASSGADLSAPLRLIFFLLFISDLKKPGTQEAAESRRFYGERAARFKGVIHRIYMSSSNGRGAHEDDGRCARARAGYPGIPPSQISPSKMPTAYLLVPPRRGRRGPPVCSPRESGSQTVISRKPSWTTPSFLRGGYKGFLVT